jgi:hypothetical protein
MLTLLKDDDRGVGVEAAKRCRKGSDAELGMMLYALVFVSCASTVAFFDFF